MAMRPEYIAIQAAIIRGFAKQEGITFPELAWDDESLVQAIKNEASRLRDVTQPSIFGKLDSRE